MKIKFSILTLVFLMLFGIEASADDLNITGLYEGSYACGGRSYQVSVRIVHQVDNSLRVVLSVSPDDYQLMRQSEPLGITGVFKSLETDIVLENRNLLNRLIINAAKYKKHIIVKLNDRCGVSELQRNTNVSKEMLEQIKKERKEISKARGQTANLDLRHLNGFWMSKGGNADYRLVFENNNVSIQKMGMDGFMIPLAPMMVEQNVPEAKTIFRPAVAGNNIDFDRLGIIYKPATNSIYQPIELIELYFLTLGGKWSRKLELNRPTIPNTGPQRVFGDEAFVYQDWQHREHDGFYLVKDSLAEQRLRRTIDALYERGGWRCLAQSSTLVSPGRVAGLSFRESGTNTLYLIYSPYGNAGLLYTPVPTKYIGRVEGTSFDYPVFLTTDQVFPTVTTRFYFSLQPSFANPLFSSQEIPVTLFILGRTFGDYGTGCEYYASKEIADRNRRNQIIGKIILAFLLEYGRRVSNEAKADVPQLVTTAARNEFVKSLVHDLVPSMKADETEYVTRWITLAMSGDFRPQNYARETIRESILQKAAKEKPEYKFNLQVMDLLLDLIIQRRGW